MQNRGPSPGFSGYRVRARYDKGCLLPTRDAHRVTPHSMRGPVHDIRGIATRPLSRIFLDTASERGMTKGVTPHSMRTVSPRTRCGVQFIADDDKRG